MQLSSIFNIEHFIRQKEQGDTIDENTNAKPSILK